MALQYFSGFEDGTLLNVIQEGAGYTNVATTPRSGARRINMTSGSMFNIPFPTDLSATADACIVGFGYRTPDVGTDTGAFFGVKFGSATSYIRLTHGGSGIITAETDSNMNTAGTSLGSSAASTISADTWHFIEMRVIFSDTVGVVEVYVDGNQVINLTSQDTIGSGSGETARTAHFRGLKANSMFDDVYLLDPTGEASPYNTFLGPIEIERLVPDGDSLTTNWNTTTTLYYTEVDEVPVTNTENVDTFTTSAPLRMTIGNRTHTGSILGVKPHCVATLDAGVAPKDLAPFMRADPGGTPTDSTKTGTTLAVGEQEVYNIVLDDPDTAADWTTSGLNGAEVGFEVV